MPTLERTNPVENPQRTNLFLTCYVQESDFECYTCRFEVQHMGLKLVYSDCPTDYLHSMVLLHPTTSPLPCSSSNK